MVDIILIIIGKIIMYVISSSYFNHYSVGADVTVLSIPLRISSVSLSVE